MKVDILLATYNGAVFIEEQLLSLLGQTHKEWILYIHDDGSIDDTIEIIKKYQSLDKRINLIENDINNLGPALNFLELLKYSKSDFCMFCDQDDIWLANKVELMLKEIAKKNNTIPQALYSNSYVYNSDRSTISGKATLSCPNSLNNLLFLNSGVQGCAIIFNKFLRDICQNYPSKVCMHDHLICLAAVTFGELHYFDVNLMLYRQHSANVTGKAAANMIEKVSSFLKSNRSVIDRKHFDSVVEFYKMNLNCISDDKKRMFEAYFNYPTVHYFKRLYIILKYRFFIFDNNLILIIKTLIRKPIN